jgi:hypothetical protein
MVLRFAIRFFANNAKMNAMGSLFPSFTNFVANLSFVKKEWELLRTRSTFISKANFQAVGSRTTKINFDKDNSICFVMN